MLPEISNVRVRELLIKAGQHSILGDEPFGSEDPDEPVFEHLLHEVAHGQALNLGPFTSDTPKAVSQILGGFRDQGKREEAKVWAIEWLLWPRLELPWSWGEMLDQAAVQGVSEPDIQAFVDDPHTAEVAERTFSEVLRLCVESA